MAGKGWCSMIHHLFKRIGLHIWWWILYKTNLLCCDSFMQMDIKCRQTFVFPTPKLDEWTDEHGEKKMCFGLATTDWCDNFYGLFFNVGPRCLKKMTTYDQPTIQTFFFQIFPKGSSLLHWPWRFSDHWSIKNWIGSNPNGPYQVSCDQAISYSGFFGARSVLLEIFQTKFRTVQTTARLVDLSVCRTRWHFKVLYMIPVKCWMRRSQTWSYMGIIS